MTLKNNFPTFSHLKDFLKLISNYIPTREVICLIIVKKTTISPTNGQPPYWELFSWKTTPYKDHLEVCLPNSWLLSDLIGMWSSIKIVKLCVHFCVCVSKSLRKWTQTDTKVTFHPPPTTHHHPPENFFWSQMKGMAKIRLFYSSDMALILPR